MVHLVKISKVLSGLAASRHFSKLGASRACRILPVSRPFPAGAVSRGTRFWLCREWGAEGQILKGAGSGEPPLQSLINEWFLTQNRQWIFMYWSYYFGILNHITIIYELWGGVFFVLLYVINLMTNARTNVTTARTKILIIEKYCAGGVNFFSPCM